MIIIGTTNLEQASLIAMGLIQKGAGFTVHTLEIFQRGPVIETGDDMWDYVCEFCKERNLDPYIRVVDRQL